MGRAPCCDKANVKKGPWSPEEDTKLKDYIENHGTGANWIALPQKAGLKRCGKSCRLRWLNYLRPNLKHGEFSDDEDRIICNLFSTIGSRWSIIAGQLPGRTDNDIKNYWNTKLKKKLMAMNISSTTQYHQKRPPYNYQPNNINPLDLQNSLIMPSPYQCGSNIHSFTTALQPQDEYVVGPTNRKHSNFLMFGGGDQASCSSSDGSSITNQIISNNNSVDENNLCLQSYFSDENQKLLISGTNDGYSSNGCLNSTENPLDYNGIEEIKQLISTNNNSVCNNLNSFFVDDVIKTEEQVLDYY